MSPCTFLIPLSLEPDGVINLWYFKLRLFDLTDFILWNIKLYDIWLQKYRNLKNIHHPLHPVLQCISSLRPLISLGFPRNGYIFCAKFALFSRKFFFCELLRNFCAWNAMSFARFCAIFFAQFAQNRKYFLRIFAHETKIVLRKFFCAICAKPEVLRKT